MPQERKAVRTTIKLRVEAGNWPSAYRLTHIARHAVDGAVAAGAPATPGSELSLLFTDDRHIQALNARWRKIDKPTNVLSFPSTIQNPASGPFLGDIALAFETIDRECTAQGLTFDDHLTHLIVHGFLHLLGFDHVRNDEADRMEGLEAAILGGLGIKDPYREPGA